MSIFNRKKKGGAADIIRCDEPNYLIWKWHPNGAEQGKLKRETAIRTGSVLRVKDGEIAVFVYKKADGKNLDFIVGPYDGVLKTKNFPVLSSLIGLWYDGDTPFQAEVFFINTSNVQQIKFAIPFFDVADPRYDDFFVPVSIRGTITFKIKDYQYFIKCHQLVNFDFDLLKKQINDTIIQTIKSLFFDFIKENNIPVLQIEKNAKQISDNSYFELSEKLFSIYGITVTNIDINSIEIDKTCNDYIELRNITKDIILRKNEADISDYEERMKINREEQQYAQHLRTKQENINVIEAEIKGEVGIASADAFGKINSNGNTNIGGGSSSGFDPIALMAGLSIGQTVGKNISESLQQDKPNTTNNIPDIPQVYFYVVKDEKAVGPFNKNQIMQMILKQEIKVDTLVWKQGTPSWKQANSFEEFQGMFPPKI